jgi:hypothetical protein
MAKGTIFMPIRILTAAAAITAMAALSACGSHNSADNNMSVDNLEVGNLMVANDMNAVDMNATGNMMDNTTTPPPGQ